MQTMTGQTRREYQEYFEGGTVEQLSAKCLAKIEDATRFSTGPAADIAQMDAEQYARSCYRVIHPDYCHDCGRHGEHQTGCPSADVA